eukprot:1335767-Prymnesium_polylepis.1
MRGAERAYGCMNYISPPFICTLLVWNRMFRFACPIFMCVRPQRCMGYGHTGMHDLCVKRAEPVGVAGVWARVLPA